MKTHTTYREILKEERKALAVEAYRVSPNLRMIRFMAWFIPFVFAAALSREFPPGKDLVVSFGVTVPSALILSVLIWEVFGRPRLRAEVERIKNA